MWEHIYYPAILKGLSLREAGGETRRVVNLDLDRFANMIVRNHSREFKRSVALAQASL